MHLGNIYNHIQLHLNLDFLLIFRYLVKSIDTPAKNCSECSGETEGRVGDGKSCKCDVGKIVWGPLYASCLGRFDLRKEEQ